MEKLEKGSKNNDVFTVEVGTGTNIAFKSSKGTDTLRINGLNNINSIEDLVKNFDCYIQGNDVIVVTKNNDNPDYIRLIDYFKLGGKHSIKYLQIGDGEPISIYENDLIIPEYDEEDLKKGKFTGTNWSDDIDVSDYRLALKGFPNIPDEEDHDRKGVTISTKNGNDHIVGSIYSDTITGGVGYNTIEFTGDFGNDTICLTKNENLILDLSEYGFTKFEDLIFDNSTNHLKITVPDDGENNYGTIILKDYTKKDVVTSNGSIKIKFADDNIQDLRNYDGFNVNTEVIKTKITGTRFAETINVFGYDFGDNSKAKVTIDGKDGYNTIVGTDGYTDILKGGNDGNDITAYNGNKTVTTGKGDDIITITGEGKRVIKASDGVNIITIDGDGENTITTGKDRDVITVNSETKNSINAGNGKNIINISGHSEKNVVKTGQDNDTINIGEGYANTTVYAGKGENTLYVDNSTCWGTVTLKEEKVNAMNIIEFSEVINFGEENFIIKKEDNNLIFEDKSLVSFVVLEQFFGTNKRYADYKFKINGEEKTFEDLIKESGGIYVTGSKTVKGTEHSDIIEPSDYKSVKIYPGKGNDTIYPYEGLTENGKVSIYFYEGDGTDTVEWGDAETTIVFEKNTKVTAEYKNGDLILHYGNGDDKVILPYFDFTYDCRKYYSIGNKKQPLTTLPGFGKFINIEKHVPYINGTDKIDVIRYYSGYDNPKPTTINTKGGSDYIVVNGSNCTIDAGDGDDTINASESNIIYGGKGDDTFIDNVTWMGSEYHFKKGDGNDILQSRAENVLVFDDITDPNDISIITDESKIKIEYNNGQDSLTWYPHESSGELATNYTIQLADGKVYVPLSYLNFPSGVDYDGIIGTPEDDNYYAFSISEPFYAGAGNDNIGSQSAIIYGGKGSDTLTIEMDGEAYGGEGDDTLICNCEGFLYGEEGNDTLIYGPKDYRYLRYSGATLNGGVGNDTYKVDVNFESVFKPNNPVIINDTAGESDTLICEFQQAEETKAYFNVYADKTYENDLYLRENIQSDVHIYTDEGLVVYDTIKIENYFGEGRIEKILLNNYTDSTSDDKILTFDESKITGIVEQVSSWLTAHNYNSTTEVLIGAIDPSSPNYSYYSGLREELLDIYSTAQELLPVT